MYVNDMRWAGRLTQDPRVLEPRTEGDRFLFSFCVAQTIPWRNKSTGKTEENTQYINVAYRCTARFANDLKAKLKKGQFLLVDGELLIENRDTPNGRIPYVTINASKLGFPPVQHVNSREPSEERAPESKPASAQESHPDYFNPAKFEDDVPA